MEIPNSYDEDPVFDNDTKGVALNLKTFDPDDYDELEILLLSDQIIIPDYTLRKSAPKHVSEMFRLLKRDGYRTSTGLLSVTVRQSKNSNLNNTNVSTITSKPVDQFFIVLNDGVSCDIVDGMHRHRAMNRLKEGIAPPEWLGKTIRAVLVRRKDGKDMSNTEILQHASLRNHRASAVKKDKVFLDFIFSVMSYTKSLAQEHNVQVEDIRVVDLMKSMKSAGYLSSDSSYRRYARIGKSFCRIEGAVENVMEFMKEMSEIERSRLGPTHIDSVFINSLKNEAEACSFLRGLLQGC